jgi:hypothetical protein
MRHVHLHLQGIDLLNQIDTCRCQSRPGVRAAGKRTVNAAAEAVRNIPERTNAADPGGIKGLQIAALAIKTSGTLNMRHHRQALSSRQRSISAALRHNLKRPAGGR